MYDKHEVSDIVVGLDIGTSKVAAVIGRLNEKDQVEVIGIGTHPSTGLIRGVVNNIDETVSCIEKAIGEVETLSGEEVNSVYVGIAGDHISGKESKGIESIPSGTVTENDVEKILRTAKAVPISSDQVVLHALPKQYTIDGQSRIIEPLGMAGVRLETDVHIVTGSLSATKNIINSVEKCGLVVNQVVLEQLASSYAVLSKTEKELGVCLVDIGGGTTDIAVFLSGTIRHTSNIPLAGDHVTGDVSVFLRIPKDQAEDIKIRHACAEPGMVNPAEKISYTTLDGKSTAEVTRQGLSEVVSLRYRELLEMVQAELRRSGFEPQIQKGGIVLTGGCSRIEGMAKLAEEIFNVPIKIGYPENIVGMSDVVKTPNYATGVGLLHYGIRVGKAQKKQSRQSESWFGSFVQWVKESF